jgi:hypothetical protein
MLNKNNRGQIGDTLTWLIATVIIIAVMLFFIFGASTLGQTKKIGDYKRSLFSEVSYEGDDLFLKKSLFTYNLVQQDEKREIIMDDLEKWETQGKFDLLLNETKIEISRRGNS